MTWHPSARTTAALAIYEAAEQDRESRPERYRLDPDVVLERVAARGDTGEAHFAKGWRTGLETFLHSAAEEGRLKAVGARMALQSAIGRLTAGAKIAKWREDNPARADTPLAPPIVIVGGWRTRTV